MIAKYLGSTRGDKSGAPGWLNYRYCTYYLYRAFASEGWFQQSWSLKSAQVDLLQWEETNEAGIDGWLIEHGYSKKSGGVERPIKGEMWRCPDAVLGSYSNLDTYSTYCLYRYVLLPALLRFRTDFSEFFFREVVLTNLRCCIDNYQVGIFIDTEILKPYKIQLEGDVADLRQKFYEVKRTVIDQINAEKRADLIEPEKTTKTGKVAARWLKYQEKLERIEANGPLVHEATPENIKPYIANLNSVPDKQRILYDGVDYYHSKQPDLKKKRPGRIMLTAIDLELDLSKSGGLPTGKAAILATQGPDSPLDIYNKTVKKLQFTNSTLAKVVPATSRIHMPVKFPGTLTLRLGGDGGLNLQNIVKDPGFLRAWRVKDPEKRLIGQIDFAAVEPHVLAELSKDSAMLGLYGPDAPKGNDVYIYVAALCGGDLGKPFLDLGYSPKNPDAEIISQCKKTYKSLRNAAKCIALCIAEGTLIRVRDKGLVAIEDITSQDLVWDGIDWVNSSGALHQGKKYVMFMDGVYMTPEHKILTDKGWMYAKECKGSVGEGAGSAQPVRPEKPGASWADVRAVGSYIVRRKLSRWVSVCTGAMQSLQKVIREVL